MNDLKARGYEGGVSGGVKRKETKKATARSKVARAFSGVLTLGPKAFARFEKCMTSPGEPTPANKRGAELLRALYSKNR